MCSSQNVLPEEEAWNKVFPHIFSNVNQFKELYINNIPPHLSKRIDKLIEEGAIKLPQDDAVEDKELDEI